MRAIFVHHAPQQRPKRNPAAKTKKKPAGVSQGEHEHLLPSEPDKADTQGCDARAVVDHR